MTDTVMLQYTEDEFEGLKKAWGGEIPTTEEFREALKLNAYLYNENCRVIAKNQKTGSTVLIGQIGYKALFNEAERKEDLTLVVGDSISNKLTGLFKTKKVESIAITMSSSLYSAVLDLVGNLREEKVHGFDPKAEILAKKLIEIYVGRYRQMAELQQSGSDIILDYGGGHFRTFDLSNVKLKGPRP